jgi:protein required for attachment to host cells
VVDVSDALLMRIKMKPTTTWIVIADGARARVMQNEGPGKGVQAVQGLVFKGDHSPSIEVVADKPGRAFDSVGHGRHAMEPSLDAHDELKVKFVKQIAGALEGQVDAYSRLILVAPPQALGLLRKALPAAVAGKVTGELGKDLTHLPNSELPPHLDNLLAL